LIFIVSEEVVHIFFNQAVILAPSHLFLVNFILVTVEKHGNAHLDVLSNCLVLSFRVAVDLLL